MNLDSLKIRNPFMKMQPEIRDFSLRQADLAMLF